MFLRVARRIVRGTTLLATLCLQTFDFAEVGLRPFIQQMANAKLSTGSQSDLSDSLFGEVRQKTNLAQNQTHCKHMKRVEITKSSMFREFCFAPCQSHLSISACLFLPLLLDKKLCIRSPQNEHHRTPYPTPAQSQPDTAKFESCRNRKRRTYMELQHKFTTLTRPLASTLQQINWILC